VSDIKPPVLSELNDGVLTITLNRPEAFNAINAEVSNAVAEALAAAEKDPEVAAVILTGAGGKAFSAGADLKAVSRGESCFDPDGPYGDWGLGGCTERTIAKPVIAAVDGIAFGGGFEVALAADILIASTASKFALPEVKVGLLAGAGGVVRLPRQLPRKLAMDLLLTGEPISAERAHALGLVSRLTAPGAAYAEALQVAAGIRASAPLAVQATKRMVLELADGRSELERHAWDLNAAEFPAILASNDAREGAAAFTQKRPPVWTAS